MRGEGEVVKRALDGVSRLERGGGEFGIVDRRHRVRRRGFTRRRRRVAPFIVAPVVVVVVVPTVVIFRGRRRRVRGGGRGRVLKRFERFERTGVETWNLLLHIGEIARQ